LLKTLRQYLCQDVKWLNTLNYTQKAGEKQEFFVPIRVFIGGHHLGLDSEASVNMLKYKREKQKGTERSDIVEIGIEDSSLRGESPEILLVEIVPLHDFVKLSCGDPSRRRCRLNLPPVLGEKLPYVALFDLVNGSATHLGQT